VWEISECCSSHGDVADKRKRLVGRIQLVGCSDATGPTTNYTQVELDTSLPNMRRNVRLLHWLGSVTRRRLSYIDVSKCFKSVEGLGDVVIGAECEVRHDSRLAV
jgi:hypothetical protein